LDEIQAAVLLVKLKYLDRENELRREIAKQYLAEIKNEKLILPQVKNELAHVWHLFVVRAKERDKFFKYLADRGIESLIHYPLPPHKQKAYAEWNNLSLPITEEIHQTVVSLPLYSTLTQEQILKIIEACNNY